MQEQQSPLVNARSSIVWILAVLVAFGAVWWIERQSGKELIARQDATPAAAAARPAASQPVGAATADIPRSPDLPLDPPLRRLTAQELDWARTAWAYFEANTDPRTGLAGSVAGFPSATLWDTASGLMALICAHELGLVDRAAFDARLALALESLSRMPLHAGGLPNKSYDVRTLAMTDYRNQPTDTGIGWSAIDLGRLLVPLNVIAWQHPRHTEAARRVIARWNAPQLARDGQLWGLHAPEAGGAPPQSLQEGRLGYEQYAARTLGLMGLDVDVAGSWLPYLSWATVEGVQVPVDRRQPRQYGAQNFLVSEPFILDGLELGWTRHGRELAWRVLKAQEARFRMTGVRTAVSEDHLDQAPWFAYNAVYVAGQPWATVTEKGEVFPAMRTLSVKAAFGWHALVRNDYTAGLVEAVAALHEPGKGWYAGLYEEGQRPNRALTANTNAVVLESLAYVQRGKALRYR